MKPIEQLDALREFLSHHLTLRGLEEFEGYIEYFRQLEAELETLQRIGEDKVILNEQVHALKAENEALRDGHEEIILWGKAYPIDVFPEPDLKKAHKLLKAGGMTLDAVSASNMRHVLRGVVRIANDALLTKDE